MRVICLGQTDGMSRPELIVGSLGVLVLSCYGIWALIRWVTTGPSTPDPWDSQVEADLTKDDATPLCHRCITPHDSLVHFCSNCGAAVGDYTNLLPYPYLFSIGDALRIGTSGNFKRSPLTIAGFILLSFAEYSIFAPFYWLRFARNLSQPAEINPTPEQQSSEPAPGKLPGQD
jgi:hypothetical protein